MCGNDLRSPVEREARPVEEGLASVLYLADLFGSPFAMGGTAVATIVAEISPRSCVTYTLSTLL